ncbi:MAG: biotin carboxylase N-terminal domain-containing protein, partial [Pseudomonadota bacterium]
MNYYTNNPLIHRDRRVANSDSAWVKQFDCTDVRPLIICRGPIRKEAMDVFVEMGIEHYGILLSEKDSIVYTNALAPELRLINNPDHVHRVPDYTGATKEERQERIKQIIQIAKENGYNSIYTGYGFMAEDEEMVASMESAGLNFIGPCSRTVRDAGLKDEAKRTALRVGVSVTPGIDNATTLTLLKKYPTVQKLKALAKSKKLKVAVDLDSNDVELEDKAGAILDASYDAGIDLYTIDELGDCIQENVEAMFAKYPGNRLRLKAIGGGGGKGQRILLAPSSFTGSASEKAKKAAANAPSLVREILNEVKTTGVGDNKNVLIELNIETTRHQEIQVVGNGDWCITMGGRDCSLQMHEQKLLEVSVVHEDLVNTLEEAQSASNAAEAKVLKQDIKTLAAMEEEAATFGQAVGLDSVSTFECIVDRDMHFFMEMNTRIQVEHRVTELCYGLTFTNPQDPTDSFNVESLVELMVLLARHGKYLPKPTRYLRNPASVEARLNATNQALRPHAGGVINKWSDPIEGEIRDDQGICIHNPDTDVFMKYRLAGAYDSNVALILNVGSKRLETYQRLSNIIRSTVLQGTDLQTNLQFHYGLVNWFIGNNINARPTTRFIVPYLTLVGRLKQQVGQLHWDYLFERVSSDLTDGIKDADVLAATKDALQSKRSLLLRPLKALCEEPHVLSGWLSVHKKDFDIKSGKVIWHRNPLEVLADTYHFLNMDACDQAPAADVIWGHDQQILSQGLAFYDALTKKVKITDFAE